MNYKFISSIHNVTYYIDLDNDAESELIIVAKDSSDFYYTVAKIPLTNKIKWEKAYFFYPHIQKHIPLDVIQFTEKIFKLRVFE